MRDTMLYEFLAGIVLIAVVLGHRYSVPSSNRHFTTREQFYTGLGIYVVIYLVLYTLLGVAAMNMFGTAGGLPAVWLAIVVGLVLPRLPVFARLDRLIRGFLQRVISGIPGEAERIQEAMLHAEYEPPVAAQKNARAMLKRRGLDAGRSILANEQHLREAWFKSLALYQQLLEWRRQTAWGKFFDLYSFEFDFIRERFDQLTFKVSRTSNILMRIDNMLELPASSHLTSLEEQMETEVYDDRTSGRRTARDAEHVIKEDLREDLQFFLRYVCLFVAKGVLTRYVTRSGRYQCFESMGFRAPSFERRHYSVVLGMFFVVLISMMIGFITIGTGSSVETPVGKVLLAVMIAINQVIALFIPVYAKTRYGFANAGLFGQLPYRFFLSAGLLAVALTFPVSVAFRLFILDGSLHGFHYASAAVWQLMSFATAVTAAVLVQDRVWAATGTLLAKRLKDAGVFALSMMATFTVVWLVLGLEYFSAQQLQPPYKSVITTAALGLCFGYLIPWTFRAEWRQRDRSRSRPSARTITQVRRAVTQGD